MTRWLEARLTWQVADPAALAAALERWLGTPAVPGLELVRWQREAPDDEPAEGGRLVFEPVELAFEPAEDGRPGPTSDAGAMHLLAVAWATVDLARAAVELAPWLLPGSDDEAPEPHLGARVRVRATAGLSGDQLVLAEPVTEGRLAAALARHGEGPSALYLCPAEGLDAWLAGARGRGVTPSRAAVGPFGRSVLLPGAAAAGPQVILVAAREPSFPAAAASTIRP